MLRHNVPPQVGTVRKCFSTLLTVQCCVSIQLLGSCPLSLNPESTLICWSSLTIDLICSVTNSCAASSLTFRRKSQRIVSTSFSLQRVRKSWLNLPSSLPVLEIDLAFLWNVIFMIVTKCQNMLRWSGQNANQKFGTDKMPTTDKSPDKMPTFGWHYVRLAFCPVGILSAHQTKSLISYDTQKFIRNILLGCTLKTQN